MGRSWWGTAYVRPGYRSQATWAAGSDTRKPRESLQSQVESLRSRSDNPRIASLRQAIATDSYSVPARLIAERMMISLAE